MTDDSYTLLGLLNLIGRNSALEAAVVAANDRIAALTEQVADLQAQLDEPDEAS